MMASRNKRASINTRDSDDEINFGKKSKQTRSSSKKGSKETVTRQQTVAERVKNTPKRGKNFDLLTVLGKKSKVTRDCINNNAVPEQKSAKGKILKKIKPQTNDKTVIDSLKGDGVVVDVDDSEFVDDDRTMGDVSAEDSDSPQDEDEVADCVTASCSASTTRDSEADKAKKLLSEHPELKHLFNTMLDERMNEVKNMTQSSGAGNISNKTKTPLKRTKQIAVTKSPSDTTLYRPVFRMGERERNISNVNRTAVVTANNEIDQDIVVTTTPKDKTEDRSRSMEGQGDEPVKHDDHLIMERISRFVDNLRVDYEEQQMPSTSRQSEINVPGQDDARKKIDRTILEAERFKATVNNPPGMSQIDFNSRNQLPEYNQNVQTLDYESELKNRKLDDESVHEIDNSGECKTNEMSERLKSDDDFFHLMCHVDQSLVSKIEKGEFVDLERLLPKERLSGRLSGEQKLEWVRTEEGTYLVPSNDKTMKINGFKKWEQAFRVYATIYCGANPLRSKEIWQYVSVISTASSSFIWDNVANYDYTFRQLMAFNPKRSWAITYHHMWSLSMKDPLPRNHMPRNVNYFGGGGSYKTNTNTNKDNTFASSHVNQTNSNNNVGTSSKPGGATANFKKWAKSPTYCWSFNRGLKCKYGNKCKYIERCSYCDSQVHGINSCPKLDGKSPPPTKK